MELLTPVSPGELIDKLTILDIKSERISDAGKRANVVHEQALLERTWQESGLETESIRSLRGELKRINEQLWDIEDDIRVCEKKSRFWAIALLNWRGAVYVTNDKRAAVKKRIKHRTGIGNCRRKILSGLPVLARPESIEKITQKNYYHEDRATAGSDHHWELSRYESFRQNSGRADGAGTRSFPCSGQRSRD